MHNLCFKDRSKNILIIDIIINVIEEMRMERKIKMVIQGKKVDEYCGVDITDIDMKAVFEDQSIIVNSDFDKDIQDILTEKLEFRHLFADQMSLIKLNYMFCVLQNIYGSKASISDPDAFKDKIKAIEKAAK